jgi:hypothetical protein
LGRFVVEREGHRPLRAVVADPVIDIPKDWWEAQEIGGPLRPTDDTLLHAELPNHGYRLVRELDEDTLVFERITPNLD